MKVLLQRVRSASVAVGGERVSGIGPGLLLLVGVGHGDTRETARELASKAAGLRIFSDEAGRFNLSLVDIGGDALVVSQFTLLGDTRRGRRPSFTDAAPPELARALEEKGIPTSRGRFGAHMLVELLNDGPVTLLLEG